MRKKSSLLLQPKYTTSMNDICEPTCNTTRSSCSGILPNSFQSSQGFSSNARRPSPPTDRQSWTTTIIHPAHTSIRRDFERERQLEEERNLIKHKQEELHTKIEQIKSSEQQELCFQKELVISGLRAELEASQQLVKEVERQKQEIVHEKAQKREDSIVHAQTSSVDRRKYWIVESILANREVPDFHQTSTSVAAARQVHIQTSLAVTPKTTLASSIPIQKPQDPTAPLQPIPKSLDQSPPQRNPSPQRLQTHRPSPASPNAHQTLFSPCHPQPVNMQLPKSFSTGLLQSSPLPQT